MRDAISSNVRVAGYAILANAQPANYAADYVMVHRSLIGDLSAALNSSVEPPRAIACSQCGNAVNHCDRCKVELLSSPNETKAPHYYTPREMLEPFLPILDRVAAGGVAANEAAEVATRIRSALNQAGTASSGAGFPAPMARGSLPNSLVDLLRRAYDELPNPEFISDPEKEERVKALLQDLARVVCPVQPIAPDDVDWARSQLKSGDES